MLSMQHNIAQIYNKIFQMYSVKSTLGTSYF